MDEVKEKRKLRKLTQENVAEYLGMSRRAYVSFENGYSNFKSEDKLKKLCDLLEIDFDKEENLCVANNSITMTITIQISFSPS